MYTVLIADDNKHWLEILGERIGQEKSYAVVGKALNGRDAIDLIETCQPDIIILDIIMPEYDGVYIVNHIRSQMKGYNPAIYILSGIGTDTIVKVLNDLDIDFYSMKPVTLEIVIENLNKIARGAQSTGDDSLKTGPPANANLEQSVTDVIHKLGMLPHRTSTKYTIEAVIYFIDHPDSFRMLTKVIYPEIAKKYGVNVSPVEKNIRYAISRMQKHQTTLYNQIFSYSTTGKISNGEFLSVVSNYLEKQIGIVSNIEKS